MFNGWLSLGGNEIANNARTIGYSRSSGCSIFWHDEEPCEEIAGALGHMEYDYENISAAPWFDADAPESALFLGASVISISGVEDSTRQAGMTERLTEGGQTRGYRHSSRAVSVRLFLTALSEHAMDYGLMWLRNTLEPGACGVHDFCGSTSLEFLTDCPPARGGMDLADYTTDVLHPYRRFLHQVTATSGPIVERRVQSNLTDGVTGTIVTITLSAERPFIYGYPRTISLAPIEPIVVQDVPYNLAPFPSAELTSGDVVISTNYATNPTVGGTGAGWAGAAQSVSGSSPTPYFTQGRVTELSIQGGGSYRARLLGNGSTAASGETWLTVGVDVPVAFVVGRRMSFNIWGAIVLAAGQAVSSILQFDAVVSWRNSGDVQISATTIGTGDSGDYGGRAFTLANVSVPSGTVTARVIVRARVAWTSSATPANNSDIRLYGDAIAATIP